jgi:hypothetical protein
MVKKSLLFVVAACMLFGLMYAVASVRASMRNTPERVAETIVKDLAASKSDLILNRMTAESRKDRDAYWQSYLKANKPAQAGAAEQISADRIVDTFHAYPPESDPHSFIYKYAVDGKEYRLTLILFKLQGQWVIDDLFGDYVQQTKT